jgi:hypothetical protein
MSAKTSTTKTGVGRTAMIFSPQEDLGRPGWWMKEFSLI